MIRALDAARLFIEVGTAQAENELGDGMTNIRLNKLLYFAQGYSLAKYGESLFDDPIEAWPKGPVVPTIYRHYKSFGKNMVVDVPPERTAFSDQDYSLLFDILPAAEPYSTNELINLTHQPGTPWTKVYEEKKNRVIPPEMIREYFIRHPFCPRSFDDVANKLAEEALIPERDMNGIPIIPKEFAEGWDWDE